MFRHMRDYAPREEATSADRRGRYVYPFFEDLTKINFTKMMDIVAHPMMASCWSSRGQLRFKLKDSQTVKKVSLSWTQLTRSLREVPAESLVLTNRNHLSSYQNIYP